MTRKDYVLIAECVRVQDRARFMRACGFGA